MKQWVGLGKFLAGHMQIIVPICVALGVLFPQQIGVLKPIVPTLFAFMTFQGALSNTFHQVAEVFHRPLHLILALLVSAACRWRPSRMAGASRARRCSRVRRFMANVRK